MNVLETMQQNKDSVIGLTLSLDLGCSTPITGIVQAVKQNTWNHLVDGVKTISHSYSVSFDGCSYYPVNCLTKIVDMVVIIF